VVRTATRQPQCGHGWTAVTAAAVASARCWAAVSAASARVSRDRVTKGMAAKAAKGKWPGGTRPYGYRVDRDTHKLTLLTVDYGQRHRKEICFARRTGAALHAAHHVADLPLSASWPEAAR
jgi:hypothetical protein